jgi:hypothetical protein
MSVRRTFLSLSLLLFASLAPSACAIQHDGPEPRTWNVASTPELVSTRAAAYRFTVRRETRVLGTCTITPIAIVSPASAEPVVVRLRATLPSGVYPSTPSAVEHTFEEGKGGRLELPLASIPCGNYAPTQLSIDLEILEGTATIEFHGEASFVTGVSEAEAPPPDLQLEVKAAPLR